MSSYSEVDSPNLTDQRLARVNPLEIAKKCVFNFEENQMLKLNEDMEKNLDLNQVLQAKSAKGGNLNPVIQGQYFKRRLDKFFVLENMLADTGCSYNICSEQICRDLRVRIYPFKRDMSIKDASGNFLKLLGSACLYIKSKVLGRDTIKKLEVAVQQQGVSEDREILLSLRTLVDWNIVHPEFPNVKLDDFIEKMINKRIGKKAYSTLYSHYCETRICTNSCKFDRNKYLLFTQLLHGL